VKGKDTLQPGSAIENLNQIWAIKPKELPEDTMLNSFIGKA
jgi:hypothetical protein